MRKIKDGSLYLVISEEFAGGRPAEEIAKEAVDGGVDVIQLREKNKPMRELTEIGGRISALCKEKGVTFIVNDDPMLARRVYADGVHMGQEDIERFSIKMVRDVIGPDRLIGISTHSVEQFKKAAGEDVDYMGYGPIFSTKTKNYNIGTSGIKEVLKLSHKPVFFVGGINLSNMGKIFAEGGRNIAVIRGIVEADDISARARQFKEMLLLTCA